MVLARLNIGFSLCLSSHTIEIIFNVKALSHDYS